MFKQTKLTVTFSKSPSLITLSDQLPFYNKLSDAFLFNPYYSSKTGSLNLLITSPHHLNKTKKCRFQEIRDYMLLIFLVTQALSSVLKNVKNSINMISRHISV